MKPVVDRVPPVALVLLGAASIQCGASIATLVFDEIGPAGMSLLRLGFAAVVLFAIVRPDPRKYSRSDLKLAAVFGLVLGVMNLSFYEALDRIPLGVALTLEFIGPLGVAVLGSRRRLDLAWALLAGIGIVLLAGPGGGANAGGVFFALLAGVLWGAYILINKRTGERFSGMDGLALAMVVTALVPIGPGIAEAGTDLLQPEILAIGLAVALMSSVVPYSLEMEALRRIPSHVFGILMSLEPAVGAVAAFLIAGQDLAARQVLAMALVVAASAGATRYGAARTPIEPG